MQRVVLEVAPHVVRPAYRVGKAGGGIAVPASERAQFDGQRMAVVDRRALAAVVAVNQVAPIRAFRGVIVFPAVQHVPHVQLFPRDFTRVVVFGERPERPIPPGGGL